MTKKRFVNKGKDIFQYGEWWCSAGGEHCADVIATALNMLVDENEQLKGEVAHYKLILMSLEQEAKRISSIRSFKND